MVAGLQRKASGTLETGTNGHGEVVVNHPDLMPDENGVGHIVFSPAQARAFAAILLKKAGEADAERGAPTDNEAIKDLIGCLAYYKRERPDSSLIPRLEADLREIEIRVSSRKTGARLPTGTKQTKF